MPGDKKEGAGAGAGGGGGPDKRQRKTVEKLWLATALAAICLPKLLKIIIKFL